MQSKADPMLLSLLEKIANPITELSLTITLKGVYAPSEQWYNLDKLGSSQINLIPTYSDTPSKY
jgi:hypothetical protein